MSTDVIIGHFLKAEEDIGTIVHSDKFVDTVVDAGKGYYFSNHGNNVFHWSPHEQVDQTVEITKEVIELKLEKFKKEISGITHVLDVLGIKWKIIYGANTFYN